MRTKNIDSLLWRGYEIPEYVKTEINRLFNMSVNELRSRFLELVGFYTRSRNRDFLVRKIAWKIQANIFGDITEEMKVKAYEIADFSRLTIRKSIMPKPHFGGEIVSGKKLPLKRDPRLPADGAILCRNYRGRKIVVKVLSDSFEFEGREYSTLSGIAREATGTNWNGFKFFGL